MIYDIKIKLLHHTYEYIHIVYTRMLREHPFTYTYSFECGLNYHLIYGLCSINTQSSYFIIHFI
jgi:hypothetical protein